MQLTVSKLKGYSIGAKDGDIGAVDDVLFDDKLWTVRYLVADTAKWLPGRKVMISPIALGHIEPRGYRSPSQRSKSRTVLMWIADIFLANTSGHIMTITAGLTIGLAAIYGAGQHRPPA